MPAVQRAIPDLARAHVALRVEPVDGLGVTGTSDAGPDSASPGLRLVAL